jgi:hypothetical protein
MSHFTVLVIGDNVEKQLQPFHEFECTGTDDEFVQDIDILAEKRAEFEEATRTKVRLADGSVVSRSDDRCYRDPTPEEMQKIGPIAGTGFAGGLSYHSRDWGDGRGYRAKIWGLPEGAEEFEERFDSFAAFLRHEFHDGFVVPFGQQPDLAKAHKYGYALLDEAGEVVKAIDRTNPNKQWDWWTVGGRWAGFFKLKPGATGERGNRTGNFSAPLPPPAADRADQVRKGDIDIEGMRDDAGAKAGEKFDRVHAVIAGRDWLNWDSVRATHQGDIEAARKAYHAQPVVADLNAADILGWSEDLERYRATREEFVATARASAIATFAVLKDGQWYERGSMGWWGMVRDEKDEATWAREFGALIDSLPDDTLLTVVDCHI